MSAKRSTQTQRAAASRPSVASLEKEIQVLRRQALMLRAELDEAGEVERFLRTRLRDLNASIRVDRARLDELAGTTDANEDGDETPDPSPTDAES